MGISYIHLGNLIKEKRLKKGFNTVDLANLLNVSSGFINNLENSKTDAFNLELLFNLCNRLDISIFNILSLSIDDLNVNVTPADIEIKNADITKKDIDENINKIITSYLDCIKTFNYNKDSINLITMKILEEFKFIKSI